MGIVQDDDLTPIRLKRKNLLLDSSLDYFIQNGIQNASMDEIAQAAGISRQTIYRYYNSKEELAFAIELIVLERILSRMQELFSASSGVSIETLYTMMDPILSMFLKEYERELKFTGIFDAYFREYPQIDHYRQMKELLLRYPNPFTELLKVSEAKGEILLDTPAEIVGETISNSLLALCQRVLLRNDTLAREYGMDPKKLVFVQMKLFIKTLLTKRI